MAAVLLVVGCVLIVTGAAFVDWPLGLASAGVLVLLAGLDLRPRRSP